VTERPGLILAGQLIDGTGAPPRERQALLLAAGRIEAVVPQADLSRTQREDRAVLDLGGATVLPGLIDTHVHLTFNAGPNHDVVRGALAAESDARLAVRALANAQAHLATGVTTLRDVGGRGFVTLSVRDTFRDGLALGPRMQASGPAITTTGGHLHYLGAIADNAEELRRRAEEVLDAGAEFVKLCATGGIMTPESDPLTPQYTTDELRVAVDVAEGRGTLVAAHVLSSEGVERCVAAGVRSLEHCLWQDAPGVYQFRPDVAAVMREKGIFAGLTFAGISQMRYLEETFGRTSREDMGAWRKRMEGRYEAERAMVASGVRYVLHSDAGVRETPFGSFWLILATACFELKLSPLEAITAATASAAALMGLDGEIGTLEAGKRTDLLVVDRDPCQGIEALSEPRMVLLDGRIVAEHRELRLPAVPRQR
jgi:imidazolonepropionase-like amidohydrolase